MPLEIVVKKFYYLWIYFYNILYVRFITVKSIWLILNYSLPFTTHYKTIFRLRNSLKIKKQPLKNEYEKNPTDFNYGLWL